MTQSDAEAYALLARIVQALKRLEKHLNDLDNRLSSRLELR